MNNLIPLNLLKRKAPSAVLGLTLEGGRLEGAVVRRSNGSLEVTQSFSTPLSLDPLTNDIELVGREILNHLESAGIRERHCVAGVPLKWILAAHTALPSIPEADIPGFLAIEAERGFPTDPETLRVATSRLSASSGERYATFIGVPRSQLDRLEQVLRAAKLKPLSLSLAIAALQPAAGSESAGTVALGVGQNQVDLQITAGGGVAALRALEGALTTESGDRVPDTDFIVREARITLGQLPPALRNSLNRVRVFGSRDMARRLAEDIRARMERAGLTVESVEAADSESAPGLLPKDAPLSPALGLAARFLSGQPAAFEFLAPRVSQWHQLTSRYGTGRWRQAGAAAAAILVLVAGAFLVQQWQLARLRSRWSGMAAKVRELNGVQDQIRKYQPWFDTSFRYLNVLKSLTGAFPEDGSVTTKTLEIRETADNNRDAAVATGTTTVTCSGNAASYAAWIKTVHQVGEIPGITDLSQQTRGKSPMQFTLEFHMNTGGRP
ncbi:MAG: hypothetical protein U1F98_03065 [Verrucomicrobiota bacterium]